MRSLETDKHGIEPTPEQPPIDKGAVLNELFDRVADEYGIDVTEDDVRWLTEETEAASDDGEFIEWLMSLAAQSGVDPIEFLQQLGIPLEQEQETE